jgi:anthranilate synthase component 2
MPVLLLDNYDSFTYNLYDYMASMGYQVEVIRNDKLKPDDVDHFSHIVLSPGPGLPQEAGLMMKIISNHLGKKPILGVCLGMQALALHLGDELYNLERVQHGQAMQCKKISPSILLDKIEDELTVGLYHSWAISGKSKRYRITSVSKENVIMSIENVKLKCFGVQFHPESILTPRGKQILKNFLQFQ